MLSYQHSYHAGSFADVIKHLTLCLIMDYMAIKDKPFVYLETHSGRGLYNFKNTEAQKTSEFLEGISLLWDKSQSLPVEFLSYFQSIERLNSAKLLFYPGSPYLAIERLRKEDRGLFFELHPGEFEHLKGLSKESKRVSYLFEDGLQALVRLSPPPEKRGLMFIDPPYERRHEYKMAPEAIKKALQKFRTGIFCLWYPILDSISHTALIRSLQTIQPPALQLEFFSALNTSKGMKNCGMWIINPPYILEKQLKPCMDYLCKIFNPGKSSYILNALNFD